jgi:molybdopterin-containing oxidoreductase family iron-sulfur binding subunit
VFGDLADTKSQVAHCRQDTRSYGMLAEMNVKPRTTYMAKIRNPHPDLRMEGSTATSEHS